MDERTKLVTAWETALTDATEDLQSLAHDSEHHYRERLMALAVKLSGLATGMARVACPDGSGFRVDDRTPDVIDDRVLQRRLEVYRVAHQAAQHRQLLGLGPCSGCDDNHCECHDFEK